MGRGSEEKGQIDWTLILCKQIFRTSKTLNKVYGIVDVYIRVPHPIYTQKITTPLKMILGNAHESRDIFIFNWLFQLIVGTRNIP